MIVFLMRLANGIVLPRSCKTPALALCGSQGSPPRVMFRRSPSRPGLEREEQQCRLLTALARRHPGGSW